VPTLQNSLHLPIMGRSSAEFEAMRIGEAAKRSGVTAKMIRHYEAIGLLPTGTRSANDYRDYGTSEVHELRFIRRARDLGFSLAEIDKLLNLWRDKNRRSAEARMLAKAHLADVERRIKALRSIALSLRELVEACHGDDRPDCPILGDFAGERAKAAQTS
jgi:MerR family transcriptional regulator, copper efflux regulator